MIALAILEVVFPVFALALVGFVWIRRGWGFDIAFVTRLAVDFAVPCLVFQKLATTTFEPDIFWSLAGATLALYAGLGLVFAAVLRGAKMSSRAFLLPLVSANTGNMGLPLCLFAFGEAGLVYAIVIFATMAVLQFTIGLWWVSGEASPFKAMRHPLVIASILGAVVSWAGITLPTWIDSTLVLAGQPAIPLMLIALGASMATMSAAAPMRAIALSVLKFVVSILLAIGIARVFGLEDVARDAFILQAVTPVAVTTYMLAERYDRSPAEVAQLVMVSTVLVALLLPGLLFMLL